MRQLGWSLVVDIGNSVALVAVREEGTTSCMGSASVIAYYLCLEWYFVRDACVYGVKDALIHMDRLFSQISVQHDLEHWAAFMYQRRIR